MDGRGLEGGEGTNAVNGRNGVSIAIRPSHPYSAGVPGRGMSGFNRSGRQRVPQTRSAGVGWVGEGGVLICCLP